MALDKDARHVIAHPSRDHWVLSEVLEFKAPISLLEDERMLTAAYKARTHHGQDIDAQIFARQDGSVG